MLYKFGILLLGLSILISAQSQDLYQFFQPEGDFVFLKNIEAKIETAKNIHDVQSLSIYAATLFYVQNMTGKVPEKLHAGFVLQEAINLAYNQSTPDPIELKNIAKICGSKVFGPNDKKLANEINQYADYLISSTATANPTQNTTTNPNTTPDTTPNITTNPNTTPIRPMTPPSPKDILRAREYARVNALEQVAEQIFGILIQSFTQVQNFVLIHDEVIATLKADLMSGATFGEGSYRQVNNSYEIEMPVVVKKKAIISSIKTLLLRKNRIMTESEERRLENSLQSEYKATGLGIVDKK